MVIILCQAPLYTEIYGCREKLLLSRSAACLCSFFSLFITTCRGGRVLFEREREKRKGKGKRKEGKKLLVRPFTSCPLCPRLCH